MIVYIVSDLQEDISGNLIVTSYTWEGDVIKNNSIPVKVP